MAAIRYPWDEWFSRSRFRLYRGRDYWCGQAAIVQQIRTAACQRGLRVSVRDETTAVSVELRQPAEETDVAGSAR